MVKLNGPAMSLSASGSLGGVLTFSTWKGRAYARRLVRPANPKSGGQVGVRSLFKFISQNWAAISAGSKASWETRADQKIISPFNAYMGFNQSRWRDFLPPSEVDPADAILTVATPGVITAVAGVRSITLTIPITTANQGWGVTVYRALTTGFSPAFDNLIGVGLISGTDDVVVVDTPLEPDEYFYNFRTFTVDGAVSADLGEESATVT